MTAADKNPNELPEDVEDIVGLAVRLFYRASDLRTKNPRAAAILTICASDLEVLSGRERSALSDTIRHELEIAISPRH